MTVLSATVWITVGLTFYGGDFVGSDLACGGTYTEPEGTWAAVPIEWVRGGYVHCGDTLTAVFADGTMWTGPVRDTGCHLHYSAWDTGKPFGADFPVYVRDQLGAVPTGTGKLTIQHRDGSSWSPPPTWATAWGQAWCEGPLTWYYQNQSEYVPE